MTNRHPDPATRTSYDFLLSRSSLIVIAPYLFALASLATGVALLIFFLATVALWLALLVTLTLAGTLALLVWRRLPVDAQQRTLLHLRAGVLAGLLATLCYDLSRYLLVRFAGWSFQPFESFRLFGQLLVGASLPESFVLTVGTGYHLANGVGFGIGYAFLFGARGWRWGIAWALFLELLMVSFYPGWLGLQALDEFLSVSVVGHLVYGSVLGWSSRNFLHKKREEGGAR